MTQSIGNLYRNKQFHSTVLEHQSYAVIFHIFETMEMRAMTANTITKM